ncbi:SAM-dependent methyltransferase [Sphaerisporangium album]|uniref:SAM-dependent methyltransferase n=1 Tax=Sphaerisporangium album TaxID=509200 RepID=A0A367FD25_9ACTN|nr:N-6 DNA methylase [Sphaerisporangium album]RCG28283.1 SAM-dependent methyltransferase [Sphaerisporangium album]
MSGEEVALVAPVEIARLAGVSRAAVSNWRRRHADFPEPSGGTATNPLFSVVEVRRWLDRQGKGQAVSDEVRLWQALRTECGDDMIGALVALGEEFLVGEGGPATRPLSPSTVELARQMADERTPHGLLEDLSARLVASSGRAGGEHVSTPGLVRLVRHFAGDTSGTVYDPACGIGDLLLSCGGPRVAWRMGQDQRPAVARFAELRSSLGPRSRAFTTATGDSLRYDRFPELRADLVVCDPPAAQTDWGRDALLVDRRWELAVPPRAESELAWLQHCYFHTAPGGRAVLVLPASVAYRRSGKRIRAELVRKGILDTMVALPAGLVPGHALPVHLWVLRRPETPVIGDVPVRMIDLTDLDPEAGGKIEPASEQVAEVSMITLLGDEVDLSPTRYVAASQPDYVTAYATARARLEERLRELVRALPELPVSTSQELTSTLNVSELIKNNLVSAEGDDVTSRTELLDTDYLKGFLRGVTHRRRNTSATGTYRADLRGASVPQMDIERQRRYGAVFRELESFTRDLDEAAKMGRHAARLAHEGLTSGALDPPPSRRTGTKHGDDKREGDE